MTVRLKDVAELSYNRALKVLHAAAVCLSRPSCTDITANATIYVKYRLYIKGWGKRWAWGSEGSTCLSSSAQGSKFASSHAAETIPLSISILPLPQLYCR